MGNNVKGRWTASGNNVKDQEEGLKGKVAQEDGRLKDQERKRRWCHGWASIRMKGRLIDRTRERPSWSVRVWSSGATASLKECPRAQGDSTMEWNFKE